MVSWYLTVLLWYIQDEYHNDGDRSRTVLTKHKEEKKMNELTRKVLDRIEKEYRKEKRQSVVAHGLYTISRIRREIKQEEVKK